MTACQSGLNLQLRGSESTMASNKNSAVRLFIIENRLIVRAGLRMLIESWPNMKIIGETSGDYAAQSLAERAQPDVILVSVDMQGNNNLDLLPELISAAPKARVLLLTSVTDPELHWRAVQLGVMGVVLKEQAPEVLLEAIKRVHAGEVWLDPTMVVRLVGALRNPHKDDQPSPEAARIASLTLREREVVALVCEGLRNRQISDQLCITENTVRHHLGAIYDKLRVTSRLELVISAFREGVATPQTSNKD